MKNIKHQTTNIKMKNNKQHNEKYKDTNIMKITTFKHFISFKAIFFYIFHKN